MRHHLNPATSQKKTKISNRVMTSECIFCTEKCFTVIIYDNLIWYIYGLQRDGPVF